MLLAAAQAGVPVREATPNEVKVGVTGYGDADKAQVGRMVAVILQLAEVPAPRTTPPTRSATAICIANAERPGTRVNAGQPGQGRRPGPGRGRADHARRDAVRAGRPRGDRDRDAGLEGGGRHQGPG